jgi:putative ABC transport system permease protein
MLHRIRTLWRNLARRRGLDDDLDEEIRSYRIMLEDEKTRAGASPAVARREALIEVGGTEQVKEEVHDVRLGSMLLTMGSELRQAMRALRRNPSLAITAALMLALGIGASTAVFSIFYTALLQPLPFRESDRVVQIWETRKHRNIDQASVSEANFWDVRAQNHAFEEMAAYRSDSASLTGDGPAEKVTLTAVSAGFFRTLGVAPVLGRDFSYDDGDGVKSAGVVILGNRFWRTRFGADPQIRNRTLRLNDHTFQVIGVLPPGEPWIDDQTYVPLVYQPGAERGSWEFDVIARLARGISPEAARAELERIAGVLGQAYPKEDKGIGFRMESSSIWVASNITRRALWVLLGAVAFLLLIACLNIANLLLARGMSRKREIAMRTALGAGRARLVRFVMAESILLSGFGALLGVGLAWAALQAVRAMEISGIPRLTQAGLNPWVLGFAALLAVLTGVLSGLAPALQAPMRDIAARLREGDRQTGGRGEGRLRATLVVGEVALSFFLLVGAGLLIRSFTSLMTVDRGFQTENRLLFSVNMPGSYWSNGAGKQFLDRFLAQLSASPQVISVGAVSHRPVEGGDPGMGIASASARGSSGNHNPWAGWRIVTPGYFRAVGLPLLRGRLLDERDKPVWAERGEPAPARHVVISERLAKLLFPGEDPVGKHAALWTGQSDRDAEVVGVVGDMRERGLAAEPTLTVYLPYGRNALTGQFVVHTRGNPMALMPAVRSIVAGLDANLPIAEVRSFEEVVNRSVAPRRFNTVLLGVFSGLALLLATTGIYGVLSYSMSRRTSEIGLRVALGASGAGILKMAISQGMQPVLAGLALGAAGAWWLSRYFATLLFGVKPFDLPTYIAVAALLLATALIACWLPGRRAMRVDPAVALRNE